MAPSLIRSKAGRSPHPRMTAGLAAARGNRGTATRPPIRPDSSAASGGRGRTGLRRATISPLGAVLLLLSQSVQPAFISDAEALAAGEPVVSCEREIAAAARRYDIPLAVFYAVGLNETGTRGRLQPFSMNIDGRASLNGSLADAMRTFQTAKAGGARMIDIGCMQINHHYHSANFPSLAAMFDPARNIDYAARFLRDLKVREKSWTMAVARYNAGPDNNPAQKRYVCAVLGKMVTSGFGEWTEKARAFCQPSASPAAPSQAAAARPTTVVEARPGALVQKPND